MADRKTSLTPSHQRLLKEMQRINFGRIENLVVRDGNPVFDPPPRAIRDVKFCGENGPRPESAIDDFALKAQVLDLFAQFDAIGNGTIRCIEVKHGLPFRMLIEEGVAA